MDLTGLLYSMENRNGACYYSRYVKAPNHSGKFVPKKERIAEAAWQRILDANREFVEACDCAPAFGMEIYFFDVDAQLAASRAAEPQADYDATVADAAGRGGYG